MPIEEWKAINSHPNYLISNLGRIKHTLTGRIRKPSLYRERGNKGEYKYYRAKLTSPGGGMQAVSVHRAVALAFIPNPSNLPLVLHKDDIGLHNTVGNLYWGTYKDNAADSIRNDAQARGSRIGNSVMTDDKVLDMRQRAEAGASALSLSVVFGVAPETARLIVRRKTWTHI